MTDDPRIERIARIIEPLAWRKIDDGNKGIAWTSLHQASLSKARRIIAELEKPA